MRNYRGQVAGLRDVKPRWAYGGHCVVQGRDFIIPDDAEIDYVDDYIVGFIEVIPETVGQGTGREDKHGVEIFEGDRVKPFIGSEYVVEFKEHSTYQSGDGIHGFFIKYKCEIVGNIHEKEQENEI